jgi:hypothetical protein
MLEKKISINKTETTYSSRIASTLLFQGIKCREKISMARPQHFKITFQSTTSIIIILKVTLY